MSSWARELVVDRCCSATGLDGREAEKRRSRLSPPCRVRLCWIPLLLGGVEVL